MKTELTNLNCKSKIKHLRLKKKEITFYLLSAFLLSGLLISPAVAGAVWKISPSYPVVGDTVRITGTASPGESIPASVSFGCTVPVSRGKYQYSLGSVKIPEGSNRFTATAYGVKNLQVKVNKVIGVTVGSNAYGGVATVSKANVPPLTYGVAVSGDALSRSSVYLSFTASQTLKADSNGKFEYSFGTSSMPAGVFRVKIGNSAKTVVLRSSGHGGGGSDLVADFSASPTSGQAPLDVTFTDMSTGSPTSWKWSFGDGKISTQQNPVHTYSKAGKYTVTLTVKTARNSDTETKSGYITVSDGGQSGLVADFSAFPTSGKTPLKVTFTDKSTGSPRSWKWTFGDGTYSTRQNPVHTYGRAGKYTVTLTVKNASGFDTETKSGYITVSRGTWYG